MILFVAASFVPIVCDSARKVATVTIGPACLSASSVNGLNRQLYTPTAPLVPLRLHMVLFGPFGELYSPSFQRRAFSLSQLVLRKFGFCAHTQSEPPVYVRGLVRKPWEVSFAPPSFYCGRKKVLVNSLSPGSFLSRNFVHTTQSFDL